MIESEESGSSAIREVAVRMPDLTLLSGRLTMWEVAPNNEDEVMLKLQFDGREVTASAENFFDALVAIRRQLEPDGIRLVCNGSSRNVFPSGMMRGMGYGEKAYKLERGKPALSKDIVSIFDTGPHVEPATISEQEDFYNEWVKSLSQRG